jgi:hypothetical protein
MDMSPPGVTGFGMFAGPHFHITLRRRLRRRHVSRLSPQPVTPRLRGDAPTKYCAAPLVVNTLDDVWLLGVECIIK